MYLAHALARVAFSRSLSLSVFCQILTLDLLIDLPSIVRNLIIKARLDQVLVVEQVQDS